MIARPAEPTRALAGALVAGAVGAGLRPPGMVVVAGPGERTSFHIQHGAVLGRSRRAQLRLADPAASSLHLRFTVGPDGPAVEDVGSRNGATLNGRALGAGAAPLAVGDEIGVGDSVLRVVEGGGGSEHAGEYERERERERDRERGGSCQRGGGGGDFGPRRWATLAAAGALLCLAAALALAA